VTASVPAEQRRPSVLASAGALLGTALLALGTALALTPARADAPDLGPSTTDAAPVVVQAGAGSWGSGAFAAAREDAGPGGHGGSGGQAIADSGAAGPVHGGHGQHAGPGVGAGGAVPVPPIEVVLPARGVVAAVAPVGVLPGGRLLLPEDPRTVGWWAAGSAPGAPEGSVVVAGHLDTARDGPGALAALLDVAEGEPVELRDSDGTVHTYRVTTRQTMEKEALPSDLFTTTGPPRLVLITCGGPFDERTHSYRDNVVVVAEHVAQG
jgi:hypothetical protein